MGRVGGKIKMAEAEAVLEPSFLVVSRQLQDVVRVQKTVFARLKAMALRKENDVPRAEYENVLLQLEEEKLEHIKTKAKLAGETEKMQFALGEIDILNKQLQREKAVFESTFGKLKHEVVEEAQVKDVLQNKCEEMEEICCKQDDILSSKDAKIKDLKKRLASQKQTHKQQLSDLEIRRQQERYITQNSQQLMSLETARKSKLRRATFR